MTTHRFRRLAFFGLLALILTSLVFAAAAANSVSSSRLDDQSDATDITQLRPSECAALNLTAIVTCPSAGGNCDGTDAGELILGSPADDDIKADKGDDCILGGGGNDSLRGDQDTDVCIGGPGTDSFHPSCETRIQ